VQIRSAKKLTTRGKYPLSEKKRTYFKTVSFEIVIIDFDDIWQKYSKFSKIELASFSFHVGLLLSTFRLSKQTPKRKYREF